MNFQDYLVEVDRTWKYEEGKDYLKALDNAFKGAVGELGEVLELLKKAHHHGIDYEQAKMDKELGDLLYYTIKLIDLLTDKSVDVIANTNVDKLRARYPNGFVEGGGIR